MKKSLLLILALLLAMMLSTGTALAKSDNGNAGENSNKDKNHVQERVKKSVQEAFKAYSNEKPSQDKIYFSDVDQHWATQSIKEMAAIGLFKGYPDGTFKPNQQLTQVEAMALVMRIYEDKATLNEEDNQDVSELADVPAWAREDAGKAAKKGIIKLNSFHSGVQASRAQTAVMIAKALGLEPVDTSNMPFKDGLLISKDDAGYILALYQEGILTGSPNGNFNPNSAITRAEMASMLDRLLNKQQVITVTGVNVVDGADGSTPVTTTTVGQVLRANIKLSDGTIIGTYPVNTSAVYKWYYKDSPDTVLGTTGSYTVTSDNIGKIICVNVSVNGYAGTSTWTSGSSSVAVTGVSVVDGADGYTAVTSPIVGQVIRANIALSDGTTIGSYPVNTNAVYKWYYAESKDTVLGTTASYTVTSDNVGKTVCVDVSVNGYADAATWTASSNVII
jgi:hypothetical protein